MEKIKEVQQPTEQVLDSGKNNVVEGSKFLFKAALPSSGCWKVLRETKHGGGVILADFGGQDVMGRKYLASSLTLSVAQCHLSDTKMASST